MGGNFNIQEVLRRRASILESRNHSQPVKSPLVISSYKQRLQSDVVPLTEEQKEKAELERRIKKSQEQYGQNTNNLPFNVLELNALGAYLNNLFSGYNDYLDRNPDKKRVVSSVGTAIRGMVPGGAVLPANTPVQKQENVGLTADSEKLSPVHPFLEYLFNPNSWDPETKEARERNSQQMRKDAPGITELATAPANFSYGFSKAIGLDKAMSYLTNHPESFQEKYELGSKKIITGDFNGEYDTTDQVVQGVGYLGGTAASYYGANKLLSGSKVLQGIKNPVVRNLVTGQLADTIVRTPGVVADGVKTGKNTSEILTDVAKQQGEDFLWNLGVEGVGQAFRYGKKAIDTAKENGVKSAITREFLSEVPGQVSKNIIRSTDGLSEDTITALRKIQTIADTAGKDFSEVALAVGQKKTMKELRPALFDFSVWAKANDTAGYIKRIDFDDMGRIRIDRSPKYLDSFYGARTKDGGTFEIRKKDLDADVSDAIKQIQKIADQTDSTFSETLTKMVWNGEYRAFDEPLKKFSSFLKEIGGDGEIERIDINGLGHAQVYQAGYHSPDMVKTIREYKNSTDKELVEYAEKVIRGEKTKPFHVLGEPNQKLSNDIYKNTGIDVSNYKISLANHKVEHVNFRHGKLGQADSSMADLDDYGRLPYVIENYDLLSVATKSDGSIDLSDAYRNSDNSYAKKIILEKQVDGTSVVVVAVPDSNRRLLQIESAYKKGTGQVPDSSKSPPQLTSKTQLTNAVPTNSISYEADVVKKIEGNSFVSGELAKMSDSEIEAVIKEENLPFRDAKDVRNSAKIVDDITSGKTGHSVLSLDTPETKARRELLFRKIFGFSKEKYEDLMMDRYSAVKIFDKLDSSTNTDVRLEMYIKSGSQSEYIKHIKMTDMDGNELGKSLDEIFSQIKRRHRRAFDEYLFHKYNFERWENGVPLEVDIPQGESLKIFSQLEELHPEFKTVSEELYAFNNTLNLEWGVKSGIISETWFDNATKVYPSYVPTYREFGGDVDSVTSAEKTGHNVSTIFKKAETRHERVYDVRKLFENKIDIMVNAARKQQLQEDMIRKVLNHPSRFSHVGKILDISKESTNVRAEALMDNAELSSYLKKLYDSNLDETFTMSAYLDGKLYTVGISERLHNAFSYVTAGGNQTLKVGAQKTIDFWGKHVTGNFKKLVTGLNPYFAGRNVFRDAPNAFITTRGSMSEMVKAYPEAISKIIKKDDTWKQFCALGGADSGMMENVGKSLAKKSYNPIKAIARLNGFTESIPRYAEFLISLRHGDDLYTALKNSADVTVNFSRGGRLSKTIDKVFIPYFNARFQGFYHSARQFKGWKMARRTITRSTIAITIPTVFLYAFNHGNPHYDDLTERQKNYYFNVPLPGALDANGYPTKFFKVPKTDQFGFAFGSMVERSLRAACGDDEAFDNLWEQFSDGFLPVNTRNITENFYSAGYRAIVDNMILGKTDIKDFAGRAVIPENMQGLPPEQQYDETTSGIGIWLGKTFGVSPKVIDYLIKSYTGVVGETVLPFTQQNVENPLVQPLAKSFIADSLYSNDISNTWYDVYSHMRTMRDHAKSSGNYRKYYEYQAYTNELWKAHEQAKQVKALIDGMVANGASKDSEAVRILRNLYLEEYKKVITKYDSMLKGE